jgi:hypothetical protein
VTSTPLAPVPLRTDVLRHPPGHEPDLRRCAGCGRVRCAACEGQDGGEPFLCGGCIVVFGREP